MFAFFSCPHVSRPTIGTKSFDSASNSILSDGPTGYMTNRSSCFISNPLADDRKRGFDNLFQGGGKFILMLLREDFVNINATLN